MLKPAAAKQSTSTPLPVAQPSVHNSIYWIAFGAVVIRLFVAGSSGYTNEDAYITLRYASHIASGMGFCFNPGEHILGTTTPLYALLLSLFFRLGLPALAVGKLVNIFADGALCIVCARWALAACSSPQPSSQDVSRNETSSNFLATNATYISILSALIVALNPVHIRWSVSGMETSLVTLCGAAVWLQYTRNRNFSCFALMAILFLLRWDSLLLLAALTVGIVYHTRKFPVREYLVYACLVTPWLIFAFKYFGSPIPVTAASKILVYGWRADHDPSWIGRYLPQLHTLFGISWRNVAGLLMSALALKGSWEIYKSRLSVLTMPIAWFMAYWAAFLFSRVLLFPWYTPPPLPVYELLAAAGAISLIRKPIVMSSPSGQKVAGLLALATVIAYVGIGWYSAEGCINNQETEGDQLTTIGKWLKVNAAPGDRVMLEPIGYIGYFSNLEVVDVVGLVTPRTNQFYKKQALAPMRDIALAYKPEWCILRLGELQRIIDAEAIQSRGWSTSYDEFYRFAKMRPGRDPIEFIVFKRR